MTTKLKEAEIPENWVGVAVVHLAHAKFRLKAAEGDLYVRQRWEQMWRAVYHWLVSGEGEVMDLVFDEDGVLVEEIDGFGEKSLERLTAMLYMAKVMADEQEAVAAELGSDME